MIEYIVEKKQTSGGWTWAEQKGKLIRCKDCKHRNDIEFSDGAIHLCERFDKTAAHKIDDLERFCSWAERKEE